MQEIELPPMQEIELPPMQEIELHMQEIELPNHKSFIPLGSSSPILDPKGNHFLWTPPGSIGEWTAPIIRSSGRSPPRRGGVERRRKPRMEEVAKEEERKRTKKKEEENPDGWTDICC